METQHLEDPDLQHPLEIAKTRMIEFVKTQNDSELQETPMAIELARLLRGPDDLTAYCKGRLWCYNPFCGYFTLVDNTDLRNLLFDLDGETRRDNQPFKMNNSLTNRILRILNDRLLDKRFFDECKIGVGVKNGFLTIHNDLLELQEHNPLNRIRTYIPIEYNSTASTIYIDSFMEQTFNNPELIDLVFEFVGVALFGQGTKYQAAAIFLGEGANGKGVITQLLGKLIPATMRSSVSPTEWKNDWQRLSLDGSILNTCGELPPFDTTTWEWVKKVIAGDTTTARPVGGNQFELSPHALHVFSTNRLPSLSQTGEAISRRFRLIKFPNIVKPEDRDPNCANLLFEREAEGFLRLAVEGMERVAKRGSIAYPKSCRVEMNRWLKTSDPIGEFIKDRITKTDTPGDRISSTEMYNAVLMYCTEYAYHPPSSPKDLANKLEKKGFTKIKSNTSIWIGVKFQD